MGRAKVKKGSPIQIIGDLDLVEFTRRDGTPGWAARVTILSWSYVPTNRPKEENTEEGADLPPVEDCGENGLPFN